MVIKKKIIKKKKTERSKLSPASEKQRLFLTSDADITVFGGAAGSGKSYLGIMDMLQYVHMKHFRGVMVRRTLDVYQLFKLYPLRVL
jgi:predicted ribonuclease YlaK